MTDKNEREGSNSGFQNQEIKVYQPTSMQQKLTEYIGTFNITKHPMARERDEVIPAQYNKRDIQLKIHISDLVDPENGKTIATLVTTEKFNILVHLDQIARMFIESKLKETPNSEDN